ncbi:PucR family transcriptional regulator [Cryobacterium sp. AP23]
MTVRQIFEDAYFFAADPAVVAGFAHLDSPLRWVHASEQRDIAPLLRGGELVLMEAVNLAADTATDADRTAYLRSLSEAGVAALAIELTGRMPAIPAVMVECATELGLPLIALHRRIPFVQICESINTQLADSSLVRLRLADSMSIALSDTVRELTEIPAMLAVLSAQTHAEVVLMSLSGEEIGRAAGPGGPVLPLSFSAPVSFGGTVVAHLTLRPREEADIYLINAALERAPELLAIALLQLRPPTSDERLIGQFFAMLSAGAPADAEPERLPEIADTLGVPADGAFVGIVADLSGDIQSLRAVRQALDGQAPGQLSQLVGTDFIVLLWCDDRLDLERMRAAVRARLEELVAEGLPAIVGIGPGSSGRSGLVREVAAARGAVAVADSPAGGLVADARELAVPRLLETLRARDAQPVLDAFVEEQLGALNALDPDLLATLAALIDNWGSKTAAARALGVQRQTLHHRITRIEGVVGPLSGLGASTAPLVVAALLNRVLRNP